MAGRERGLESAGLKAEVEVERGREQFRKKTKETSLSSYRCRAHHHRVGRRAGQSKDPRERVLGVEAGAVDAREDEAPRGPRGVVEKDHR